MLELDAQRDSSVAGCVAQVLSRAGSIDVLVNNAGLWQLGVAEGMPLDEAHAIFDINFGVVRMTNAVLPGMRQRGSGHIINLGSLAASIGEPGEAFYAASKHALAGYSEALRHELWSFGIQVSLVEPGAFRTNILEPAPTPERSDPRL